MERAREAIIKAALEIVGMGYIDLQFDLAKIGVQLSTSNNYWHTFDQALVRPSLISAFENGSLEVVSTIDKQPLISKTKIKPSDHLPIILRLNL